MKRTNNWLPLQFAIVLILGMIGGYKLKERLPLSQGFFETSRRTAIQETIDLIRHNYVDPVSTDSLADDAIEAMLSHLDPHSIFIPARYLQDVKEDLQGNFEGIGVEFQIIRDTIHVVNVMPGGPSDRAGLKTGDRFLRVDDSLVAGNKITSTRIKNLLRGPGASQVSVQMLRGTEQINVLIDRGTIPLFSVDAAYMIDDTTGFIHLNKFSSTSYEECMAAFEKLNKLGMKKLIFDMRDNGGGILAEAVDIVDEFLADNRLIVYTQGDKQPKLEYRSKRPGQFEDGKLIVLVDEGSASASEVVAGAVQDWDRGIIVGRRTFGKGLVQEQYELSNGAALRLTVARYYTPAGRSIQKSYASGREDYNDEVLERFHSGELVHPDTVLAARGKEYKTKGGRTVFGGGGITPDVFVPYDSSGISADISPLYANQNFGKFIYLYYMAYKESFDAFTDAADFGRRFEVSEESWNFLAGFLADNNIQLPPLSAKDRTEMAKRIKTWMARQIWGMPGYYEVNNTYDLTVQKARALK